MDRYASEIEKERKMKDQFMARHPESPFIIGEAAGFHGLRYFPVDPSYRIAATLERKELPGEASLRTNRGGELTCRYVGDMRFRVEGRELRLRVFHAGEQVGPSVFIPFRDATCGAESYPSGRYLILQLTEDDRYTLDFNLAFNPYCAYTERFECGLPPPENDLPVSIRAGEQAWSGPEAALKLPRARPVPPRPSRRRSSSRAPRPRGRRSVPPPRTPRSRPATRRARGARRR
jgi:uncharacterized protein